MINLGRLRIDRAAKALVETHGSEALRVATQRAENAELSGSHDAAYTWKQIAMFISAGAIPRPMR